MLRFNFFEIEKVAQFIAVEHMLKAIFVLSFCMEAWLGIGHHRSRHPKA
jgi:hypothetical protein